ncbi:DNA polymerase III subunit delta' [Roseibium sp.]|uniref:DNA polymerase III subunit delta' n=1 Tax=Roseibium sp. TaxID=1936156 RepID=UPI003A968D1B
MARANDVMDVPEADRLDGMPLPRERARLIGHRETEQALLNAYRSERLHHAWILGGPKGIGKATLAYRFARFIIAHPDRFGAEVAAASDLDLAPTHPVFMQVASGGNPNLLHLRRPWDDKAKRFKTELPVDEVRRTVSFFGTTASSSAWRICIVDAADDMNISSANALLKVLEEPPARCLFLVLSHAPGRLLPTIRSRCRRLDLDPLSETEIAEGLSELAPQATADPQALKELTRFADGSLRSALTLLAGDGLAIAKGFTALAGQVPKVDIAALHGLGDLVAARNQDDNWEAFLHIWRMWLHERMRQMSGGRAADMLPFAELWEAANRMASDTEALNLDRKQVVLSFFQRLSKLA